MGGAGHGNRCIEGGGKGGEATCRNGSNLAWYRLYHSSLKALTDDRGVGGGDSSVMGLRLWFLAFLIQTMDMKGRIRALKTFSRDEECRGEEIWLE